MPGKYSQQDVMVGITHASIQSSGSPRRMKHPLQYNNADIQILTSRQESIRPLVDASVQSPSLAKSQYKMDPNLSNSPQKKGFLEVHGMEKEKMP
jgi:hypothetical protein